jgi:hypothetical protein
VTTTWSVFGFVELLKGEGDTVQSRASYEEIKLKLPMRCPRRTSMPAPAPV